MRIPDSTPMKRRPTHPGEMIREDFLADYKLPVPELAKELGVSCQSVNELLCEQRAVSPRLALRLARLFGNSAQFWINAQGAVDLWHAEQALRAEVARIQPLAHA